MIRWISLSQGWFKSWLKNYLHFRSNTGRRGLEKPFRNPFSLEGLKSSTEDLRVRRSTSMYRVFTSTRSFFFFFFFLPSLLLNTRILSARSLDVSSCWFRVFRLSGVTSSSRGSLIKSRWKFWVSGHPLTQFRGLPRWEIIGGSNWPRNNKLSIDEISKTDTFSTTDSIYFIRIYFEFKGEIQEWIETIQTFFSSRCFFFLAIFVQNFKVNLTRDIY